MNFVISAENKKGRLDRFLFHNSFIGEFRPISAVMGEDLPKSFLDSVFSAGFRDHFVKKYGDRALAGTVGCFLSHLKVHEALLDTGSDYAVVCEDDALFSSRIPDEAFDALDTYDMIYINRRMKVAGQEGRAGDYVVGLNAENIAGVGGEGYIINRAACESIRYFFGSHGMVGLPCGFDGFLQSLCLRDGEVVDRPGKKKCLSAWRELLPFHLSVAALREGIVLHDDEGFSLIRAFS